VGVDRWEFGDNTVSVKIVASVFAVVTRRTSPAVGTGNDSFSVSVGVVHLLAAGMGDAMLTCMRWCHCVA